MDFTKALQIIVRMLEHIQDGDDIEHASTERQFFSWRKNGALNAPPAAEVECIHRHIDTDYGSQSREGAEIRSSTTSDVQNADSVAPADLSIQQFYCERPPGDVPPIR